MTPVLQPGSPPPPDYSKALASVCLVFCGHGTHFLTVPVVCHREHRATLETLWEGAGMSLLCTCSLAGGLWWQEVGEQVGG